MRGRLTTSEEAHFDSFFNRRRTYRLDGLPDQPAVTPPGAQPDRLAAAVQLDANQAAQAYDVYLDQLTLDASAPSVDVKAVTATTSTGAPVTVTYPASAGDREHGPLKQHVRARQHERLLHRHRSRRHTTTKTFHARGQSPTGSPPNPGTWLPTCRQGRRPDCRRPDASWHPGTRRHLRSSRQRHHSRPARQRLPPREQGADRACLVGRAATACPADPTTTTCPAVEAPTVSAVVRALTTSTATVSACGGGSTARSATCVLLASHTPARPARHLRAPTARSGLGP